MSRHTSPTRRAAATLVAGLLAVSAACSGDNDDSRPGPTALSHKPTVVPTSTQPSHAPNKPDRYATPTIGTDALPATLSGLKQRQDDQAPDPATASQQVLPMCGERPDNLPQAKGGAYRAYGDDPTTSGGKIGNVVVLTFPDGGKARSWFTAFTTMVSKCDPIGSPAAVTADSLTDRRADADFTWSEAARLSGDRVVVASVSDTSVDPKQLLEQISRLA